MAKSKKSIFKKKWIKWGIIPAILLAFCLGMSLVYFKNTFGISSLTSNHSAKDFTSYTTKELLKGDTVRGEFKAAYDHLGIVLVRFNTFYKINNDFVLFRIKEKGAKNWFYEHKYKVDQFQPNQLFTFGFPIISDSGGKMYQFEVESVQGERNDAVAISPIEPVFVTKYQYPKAEITGNSQKAVSFVLLKTANSITNIDFLISSLTYFLPFFLYIMYQLFFEKHLKDKYILVFLPVLMLFAESFFVNNTNDLLVILLSLITGLTFVVYKLESRVAFSFSLFFLVLTPMFLALGQDRTAENFAMWAYMLLVIGTVQAVVELKKGDKGLLSVKDFFGKTLPLPARNK